MPKIAKIEYVGEEEQQCISVSAPDHLYITDEEIVTHNTIVCGTMTELAFFTEAGKSDQYIMRFFNDMKSRVESRMKGNYWGRTILDSSPNDLESPIDKYCMYDSKKDLTNYVIEGSRWKWSPEDFKDVNDTFPVYLGGNGKPPSILNVADGYNPSDIVNVPRELYQFFHDDLRKTLKDIAGIPQGTMDKLFYDMNKIDACFMDKMKSIYSCIKSDAKMPPQKLIWNQVRDEFFVKSGSKYFFYYKPSIPRVFHVDQAVSGDMAAVAFVHVERKYGSDFGRNFDLLTDLIYVVDAVIPIHPYGGRINLDSLKECITDFISEGNMPIEFGSFDSFQSEANIQFLERFGVQMEQLSVDKTMDPYMFMAQLIEQGNLKIGKNIIFRNNLRSLRVTQRKETKSLKIDHTMGDTINPVGADLKWDSSVLGLNAKDAADAVCGAVYLARLKLAVEPRCLTQVWDDDRIIVTTDQLFTSTRTFIKDLGLQGALALRDGKF